MTTMSCSQAKREGGERHGQCEFKDSERRKRTYKYPRKAPELAWDLDVRAIAVKSERSGWPFERQGGNATRLRKKKFEHQKSTMGPKSTVGMSPKPTPQSRHLVGSTFSFFFLIFTKVSVYRQRLPHLKCESEGTFSPSPTPGHSRYVTI